MALVKWYTIKREDVGKKASDPHVGLCMCCGAEVLEFVFEALDGDKTIQPLDVGKLCRKAGDNWEMETDEAFHKRTGNRYDS